MAHNQIPIYNYEFKTAIQNPISKSLLFSIDKKWLIKTTV